MTFDHVYIDNQAAKTLVLLHGTGGSKNDFLFLNDHLQSSYNLLGLQGAVLEQGLRRFFKRLGPGVFDQESIAKESKKLAEFLDIWCNEHHQQKDDLVFLGYSNGASMILATMFSYPETIRTAVLLHAMLPFTPQVGILKEHRLLVTTGQNDAMVTDSQLEALIDSLKKSGANMQVKTYPGGHEITSVEVQDIIAFLNTN